MIENTSPLGDRATRKVNFVVPIKTYDSMAELSRRTNRSMTDIMRAGIALYRHAVEAEDNGQELVVTASDPKREKCLVLVA